MTKTTARRWAYAAAAAGVTGNGLLAAFYVGFAMQDFGDPHGVAAGLGSAADYAGIVQNLLLVAVTAVVYRFFSRQQRFDRVLQVIGAAAFASAAMSGVATVAGLTPGIGPAAIGSVLVSMGWLLAIGNRGTRLPGPRRARVAWAGQLIAVTILGCGALMLAGFAGNVRAVVWDATAVGVLAWLAIPVWLLALGRTVVRSRAVLPGTETAAA
jgi:hypothetical protein